MEKELKIIVAGGTASGKSTVTYDLYQLMLREGYTVVMNFEGNPDYKNSDDFHEAMEVYHKERLSAVKKSTMITLSEKQMAREIKQTPNTEVK